VATKVVMTNGSAIDGKYGARATDVWDAVDALVAADRPRNVDTTLVKLDDGAGPAGASAIQTIGDADEAKVAVDAVVAALKPDYVMLLGGPDVIPHCTLDNGIGDDDGATLPSDLPYACDHGPSGSTTDFLAPTRVISRLPDVPAATEPDVLLRALETATGWQSRTHDDYDDDYLGITAEVWEVSTSLTLTQLFGDADELEVSPDAGPNYDAALLSRRSHFVNCHGAPSTPEYYGQRGGDYPVAVQASLVDGRLSDGAVLSAECCYGAELYEPVDDQLGMPFVYLRSGAYGFFGSTTIAYGPPDSNAFADDICRSFLASILAGASVGRAGLEARQAYIAGAAPLDPVDLKTVAQFLVLGDPSVHPVAAPAAGAAAAPDALAKYALGVGARRALLQRKGRALERTVTYAERVEPSDERDLPAQLRSLAGLPDDGRETFGSFVIRGGIEPKGMGAALALRSRAPATIHLLVQRREVTNAPIPIHVAVIAYEEDGQLTAVRTAVSR
jgi:hypothetical protein